MENGQPIYVDNNQTCYFEFRYTMTSGRTVTRGYSIYVSAEELADPASPPPS